MKKLYLFPLFLALFFSSCGGGKKKYISNLYWTWEEDQACATKENIWGGFRKGSDGFVAQKPISAIALWRKTPPYSLSFYYKSQSHFPVKISINGRVVANLPFSSGFRKYSISSPLLRRGINIIGFLRRNRREFVVKNLCFHEGGGKNFTLERNEGVTIPSDAGEVKLALKGKGNLEITFFRGSGFREVIREKKSRPLGIFPVKIKFSSPQPFLVKIKTLRGSFRIGEFDFKGKKKPSPPAPEVLFKKPYPDIFIFLIDACQASHLSLYGYKRKTSPNIEKLAKDSLVFDNAYTTAGFTRATVASIFSGLFPEHHKVRVLRASLDRRLLLLPEFLKGRGYRTAIFTASANVSSTFGFSQGIDEFFGYYGKWASGMERKMPGDFLHWVSRNSAPRFAYLHFMEPHFPIIPPPPFRNMFKKRPRKNPVILRLRKMKSFTPEDVQDVVDDYDSTIAYIDSVLGRIWDRLRKMGVYENSMIVFLSDHGEALYEHGAFGHGPIVYEEMTHIPLVVKFPSYMNLKGRVKALVQVTDIFPTIASLFGVKLPLDGKSLLKAYAQREQGDEFTVSRNFLNPGTYGIRWRNFYYIINMGNFQEELYDLKENPGLNIDEKNRPLFLYLRGKFLKWLLKYQNLSMVEKKINLKKKLSKRELENLRSLGYIK